jgi:hypothetical protein
MAGSRLSGVGRTVPRMTTPALLLPRVVRALLGRDAHHCDLAHGQYLAGRLATARPARRRRPSGWDSFRRVQADYEGAPDPDDG